MSHNPHGTHVNVFQPNACIFLSHVSSSKYVWSQAAVSALIFNYLRWQMGDGSRFFHAPSPRMPDSHPNIQLGNQLTCPLRNPAAPLLPSNQLQMYMYHYRSTAPPAVLVACVQGRHYWAITRSLSNYLSCN